MCKAKINMLYACNKMHTINIWMEELRIIATRMIDIVYNLNATENLSSSFIVANMFFLEYLILKIKFFET